MTEIEERAVRAHLRMSRALFQSLAIDGTSTLQPHRAAAGIAHIDQASDVIDSMRQRETMLRRAWSSAKQREFTED